MPGSIAIDTRKYAIYVKVIASQGDGPLIYIDSHGHIHVGPDPRPLGERAAAALKQIEAGVAALHAELGAHTKSAIGA